MTICAKSIVPKIGEPDIDESYIRQRDAVLLETLLIDRTMTAVNDGNPINIKWAIDDYAREFPDATGYGCEDQITLDAISRGDGRDLKVVTPRVKKRKEEQERRTAQKAEVFTPSWICNEQNNLVDEAWFGRKDNLFNKPNPDFKAGLGFGADFPQLRWKATYGRFSIPFLHNKKGRTWRDYVKALRLEVSCGEAPYLTSRYDTTTGKWIEPRSRIGFLDRKLRIVTEQCKRKGPEEWLKWAEVALQGCYGFEWQGDNILLARENMLYAVIEYYCDVFKGCEFPPAVARRFAEIISWNIWQMDGVKFVWLPVKGRVVTKAEATRTARMMTKTARENCLDEEEAKRIKPMTVERLVSMGLLCETRGKLVPTNGYLIVAGEDVPGIRPPRVRCRAYRGTDKIVWYDQRECEGPIADQIHDAYAFVCKNMRVGSELVETRRRDVYELPVGTVREAICNAVFHRNYLEPSEVYVALYDDRLEITSPGGLVRDMTIEQAEHGYSKIRNDGLALALSYMKEVEGWGGGVARYFTDWTAAGLPRPKLEETPGFFKVVFERKKKSNETINETVNETIKSTLISLIASNPGVGGVALVKLVGKSRATVMRELAALKQQELIVYCGSKRTGGYFLAASAQKEAK